MTISTSEAPRPRVNGALTTLRDRGERVTPARRAVIELLDGTAEHLDADEIARRAEDAAPGLHRTTAYRALATLGELGIVSHTHIGGAAAVYHLSVPDPTIKNQPSTHAHAQCTSCHAVFDVPVKSFRALATRLLTDLDFQLEPQHAALLGRCASCREAQTEL